MRNLLTVLAAIVGCILGMLFLHYAGVIASLKEMNTITQIIVYFSVYELFIRVFKFLFVGCICNYIERNKLFLEL